MQTCFNCKYGLVGVTGHAHNESSWGMCQYILFEHHSRGTPFPKKPRRECCEKWVQSERVRRGGRQKKAEAAT